MLSSGTRVTFTDHAKMRWLQRIDIPWDEATVLQMAATSRQATAGERKLLREVCRSHVGELTRRNAARFRIAAGIVFVCDHNERGDRRVITVFKCHWADRTNREAGDQP